MKEFAVYTGLRLAMFAAAFFVVFGLWGLVSDSVSLVWAVVIAFAVSGVASYFLLDRQREAFARRVQERADRAGARLEEMKSREDTD